MTNTMRRPFFAAMAIAAFSWSACGKTPTAPTTPVVNGPHITDVSPSALIVSAGPQALTITGTSFLTGLTLNVTAPDGGVLTYSGADIQALDATSFHVQVPLPLPGSYGFTIKNLNGDTSDLFAVTVQDNGSQSSGPVVLSVSPSTVQRSTSPQIFSVAGSGFIDGLSVVVTAPDGSSQILIGGDVSGVTATTFTLSVVMSKVGGYTLQVVNPTGDFSNLAIVRATQ